MSFFITKMNYESIIDFILKFITELSNASAYAFLLFLVLVSFYFLYNCLKYTIHVNAECHYCMKITSVVLAHKNSWNCLHCEQYNGFDKNGDLNRDIPSQHQNNGLFFCYPNYKVKYERNRLCTECNHKQERKVAILSQFSNQEHNENYEIELRDLKKNLEEIYSLCWDCERLVRSLGLGRPMLNYFAPMSSLLNHSSEDIFNKTYKSHTLRDNSKAALRLFLFLTIHFLLLGIIYELYTQSETAFIFKHSDDLSVWARDKYYKRFYLPFVIVVQLLFLLMDYLQFTRSSVLSWFTFGLFVSLLSLDFDMNYFRVKNDQLVYYQQRILICYSLVILLNIISIFFHWLNYNRFTLLAMFRQSSKPIRVQQKSFDDNMSNVEMENLDLNDTPAMPTTKKTSFSGFPFQMNGQHNSQKAQAFWATQIRSNGNSQVFNHFGYYQTNPEAKAVKKQSKLKRYSFMLTLFVIPFALVALIAYRFMHVSINFYNDSNGFELRLQFVKFY